MSTTPEARKAYRARPEVRAKEREYERLYYQKNREKKQQAARERYQLNLEKERERSRIKQQAHPEASRRACAKYRAVHPEECRAREAKRKAAFRQALADYKLQAGCIDCGYRAHSAALDFDHISGIKAKDVSLCGSIASALEEAQKCEVRCANCHRIRTFERRRN